MCLIAVPARAADGNAAATAAAKELVAAWKSRFKAAPASVMLSPLRLPKGEETGADLSAPLTRALIKEGVKVLDAQSVRAALDEAALASATDAALTDVAGALGAKGLVVGQVDALGGSYTANLKLLRVQDGSMVAAAKVTFDRAAPAASASSNPNVEARTLEAQLRRLADRLARGLDTVDGEARYQQFAVLPFEEVGRSSVEKQMGLLVSAELTTLLHRDHALMMLERAALTKVIDEIALGQTGLVDPAKATEVGKLAGAQGLVVGSVAEAGDRYLVNARVVDVGSGSVVAAEEIALPAADLVALSSDAVVLRSTSGAVYRSILLPGWGQFYNREPVKGGAFAVAELACAGMAVGFHLAGDAAVARYKRFDAGTPQERFSKTLAEASSSYSRRNLALYGLLAIHAAQILDAFINGRTYDSGATGGRSSALFEF